ncbi:aminoglycoside phosphotransferase family protein [Arthrobacter sp. Z1-15]
MTTQPPPTISAGQEEPGFINEFSVGSIVTRVRATPDGRFDWIQTPNGEETPASEAFSDITVPEMPSHIVKAVDAADGTKLCRADGHLNAAQWLGWRHTNTPKFLSSSLHFAGNVLRTLHTNQAAGANLQARGPFTLVEDWLTAAPNMSAAARLNKAAELVLDHPKLTTLLDWAQDFNGTSPLCPTHGSPGLANIVPPKSTGNTKILSWDEARLSIPEADVGWLLGDLLELQQGYRAGLAGALDLPYEDFAEAVLNGYGAPLESRMVAKASILRMTTHLIEYVTLVGWHDQAVTYLEMIARLIDQWEEPWK